MWEGKKEMEKKKRFLLADGQGNAFLRMSAWLFLSLSALPRSAQLSCQILLPWDGSVTLRSSLVQKGASLITAGLRVAFQAAGRILYHGDSSIPFLSWLSLVEDGLMLAVVSGERQKNSEHHRESFHLARLLACEHTYPPKAHCLSPQVPPSLCTWRKAAGG